MENKKFIIVNEFGLKVTSAPTLAIAMEIAEDLRKRNNKFYMVQL